MKRWMKNGIYFNYPICSYTVFSPHHRLLNSLNSNLFNSRCFSLFFSVLCLINCEIVDVIFIYIYQYQSFIYHTHSLLLFIVMRDQNNNIFTVNNLIRNLIIRYDFLCAFDYYCMAHWTLLYCCDCLQSFIACLLCVYIDQIDAFTCTSLKDDSMPLWWSSKQNNVWCYIKL